MRLNVSHPYAERTHEGAPAIPLSDERQLRRAVMACFLWEDSFYESGVDIAQRLVDLANRVSPIKVAEIAREAKLRGKLRHAPLLLAAVLAKRGWCGTAALIEDLVLRADEPMELLAIYAKLNGVAPNAVRPKISAQVKKGLARALRRFDEYELAKYDRRGAIQLRDVLRLVHPKPTDEAQAALWRRALDGALATPDTWEVALSGGADKGEAFERLIREGKLGYMALLRNLRNMAQAGCDRELVGQAIRARRGADKVLPFRFVAAARACPQFEPDLDIALLAAIEAQEPFGGETILLVDVSDSMNRRLSSRSDLSRMDAAAVLASMWPGRRRVLTFSSAIVEVPPRAGMAGVDAIRASQPHRGTYLGDAVQLANTLPHDRLVVLTDEQSQQPVPAPVAARAYMIDVSVERPAVGYGRWTRIEGFSENVLRFMRESEAA